MTIREALIALSYTEAKPGKWVKPIGFQAFTYSEEKGEWVCWFKPANGGEPMRMETNTFGDIASSPFRERDYLRQLKEWEQWTKKDIYTDSQFELNAIDL